MRVRECREGDGAKTAWSQRNLTVPSPSKAHCQEKRGILHNSSLSEQHPSSFTYTTPGRRQAVDLLICYIITPHTQGGKTLGVGSCLWALAGVVCVGPGTRENPVWEPPATFSGRPAGQAPLNKMLLEGWGTAGPLGFHSTHMHTHTCTHMQAHAHTCMYTHMNTHMQTPHMHTHVHTYTHNARIQT